MKTLGELRKEKQAEIKLKIFDNLELMKLLRETFIHKYQVQNVDGMTSPINVYSVNSSIGDFTRIDDLRSIYPEFIGEITEEKISLHTDMVNVLLEIKDDIVSKFP